MAAQGKAMPAVSQPNAVDEAGKWFWNFLKNELAPYPGRAWVVARVTISATLVMLLVMTFQIPNGFLGAIFTLFLSRENPTATLVAGLQGNCRFSVLATVYTLIGAAMLVDDPLTHFLGVGISLFVSFFLISITNDYGTAVAFGFTIAGAIPLWDRNTLNVNDRVENTLWLGGVVAMGIVVAIVVEYVFRRVHPTTDLTEGIEARLQTVESVLRCAAAERPLDSVSEKRLSLYARVGTSRLRRLIVRSQYSAHFKAQLGTAVALVGQLVDVAANFRRALTERAKPAEADDLASHIDPADKARCERLADEIEMLGKDLVLRRLPAKIQRPAQEEPSKLPFLSAMERIVALIPEAFSGSSTIEEFAASAFGRRADPRTFSPPTRFPIPPTCNLPCAARSRPWPVTSSTRRLTGRGSVLRWRLVSSPRFPPSAHRGRSKSCGSEGRSLAALSLAWERRSLCCHTSTRLPASLSCLWLVTAISSWIATASARLSYLGVQLALAFYLINLQEFTIQTSLSIARDRVFGVLLGLMSMWLIYDRLWVKNALDEMQTVFARNLEMFAELAEQLLEKDQIKAIKRIRQLRDQLNAGFQAVTAQADAVLFEFGPSRQRKLQIREDVRRWQPSIRTLLQVQITSVQYLVNKPLSNLPEPIAQAGVAFEKDIAQVMHAMASEVSGKPVGGVPDIRMSAAQMPGGNSQVLPGRRYSGPHPGVRCAGPG